MVSGKSDPGASSSSAGSACDGLAPLRESVKPAWVAEALAATGRQSQRERRLVATDVVWLVLAMALFRDRSIVELAMVLGLVRSAPGDGPIRSNAVCEARERLGEAPLEALATRSAQEWAQSSAREHAWRGLVVLGIDGTSQRVADSPVNRAHFGGQRGRPSGGDSGYPMLRLVVLMVLRTHLWIAAKFGPYGGTSELQLTAALVPSIPDASVTVVDRGFLSAAWLLALRAGGRDRHWLTRARSNSRWHTTKVLGPGDEMVEMEVSRAARAKDPSLPKTWVARMIRYHRPGFRPQALLTSLMDPECWPAAEIVALYHERWELELGYGEIKTDLLHREEALRSRSPEAVRQEFWGVLLAYNVLRHRAETVARTARIAPLRISFVAILHATRDACIAAAGDAWNWLSPRWIAHVLLPPRRPERQYPRAVKIKMSNYARKRPVALAA